MCLKVYCILAHVTFHAGVTRTSSFPQIGEKEFTYNKMVEAILREKGYEVRVVTLGLAVLPEGLHVFKHIPLTPLYSEETMLQVCFYTILPCNVVDVSCSNLFLVVLCESMPELPPRLSRCIMGIYTSARGTPLCILSGT